MKAHIWMRDMDWTKLLSKELPAHFIPEPKPPVKPRRYDTEQLEKIEKEKEEAVQELTQ